MQVGFSWLGRSAGRSPGVRPPPAAARVPGTASSSSRWDPSALAWLSAQRLPVSLAPYGDSFEFRFIFPLFILISPEKCMHCSCFLHKRRRILHTNLHFAHLTHRRVPETAPQRFAGPAPCARGRGPACSARLLLADSDFPPGFCYSELCCKEWMSLVEDT